MVEASDKRIQIGVSSCLLGQHVRYDGQHKHNGYITVTLGQFFDFIPFCPEVAIGLGVPRLPIRLVKHGHAVRARGVDNAEVDVTDQLSAYGTDVIPELRKVSGYILKKGSPSCGMERVKVYAATGVPLNNGTGIYAQQIMKLLPELPLEEEGRLMDPVLRENFVERVFAYHRWHQAVALRPSADGLVQFHARHKFIVLAHDEKSYRALGPLVAKAGTKPITELTACYFTLFMRALKKPATRRRHANVLQHLFGFFKKKVDAADRREMQEIIDNYRLGLVPLVVPITLLRHYLRRFPDAYLSEQYYLTPHPDELMLRNMI